MCYVKLKVLYWGENDHLDQFLRECRLRIVAILTVLISKSNISLPAELEGNIDGIFEEAMR